MCRPHSCQRPSFALHSAHGQASCKPLDFTREKSDTGSHHIVNLNYTWRGRLGKWGIAKLLGKERGRQGICKLREGHVTAGTRLRPGENVPSTSGQGAWHIGSKPYNFRQKRCQLTVNRPRCRGTDVHGQLVLSIPMEWCTYCTCMWWMMKNKRLISVIQWHAKNHLVLALSLGTMFKMQYNCPTAEFGVFSKTWW